MNKGFDPKRIALAYLITCFFAYFIAYKQQWEVLPMIAVMIILTTKRKD